MEHEGHFYTTDIARAQKEVPFPILLPTYFPDTTQTIVPEIDGPLNKFHGDNKIEIHINYIISLGQELFAIVTITEANFTYLLGDPKLNPELEQVEIEGIHVIKTRDDWAPGSPKYYSFNSNNVFYVVETHYLTTEESNKIVESMLKQIK